MQQAGEGVEPSRAELRLALAEMTADAVVPVGFGLTALYAVSTVGWLLRRDVAQAGTMASICFVMGAGFLGLALWARRHPVPPKLAHSVATGYGIVLMGNSMLGMYYNRTLSDTFNVILVLMGFAVLVRSLPYMLGFVVASSIGWLILAYHVSQGVDFTSWFYPVFGAAAVSTFVNAGYRRTALRLERARYRLRRAAELDPLTGLYNRRGFRLRAERIMELVGRVNRLRAHPLSLSVGFADYDPASPCSIDELLQSGDISMYEHKRSRSGQSPPAFGHQVGTA